MVVLVLGSKHRAKTVVTVLERTGSTNKIFRKVLSPRYFRAFDREGNDDGQISKQKNRSLTVINGGRRKEEEEEEKREQRFKKCKEIRQPTYLPPSIASTKQKLSSRKKKATVTLTNSKIQTRRSRRLGRRRPQKNADPATPTLFQHYSKW